MIFPFRRTRRLAYFFAERSLSPLYTGVCLKLRLIHQHLLIEFQPSICKAGTLSFFHPSTDLQQFFCCIRHTLFRLFRQNNHHALFMHGLIVNNSPIFFYPRMIFHSDAIDMHIVVFLRYITSEFIDLR